MVEHSDTHIIEVLLGSDRHNAVPSVTGEDCNDIDATHDSEQ